MRMLLLFLAGCLMFSCEKNGKGEDLPNGPSDMLNIELSATQRQMVDGSNHFGFDLLRAVISHEEDPHSNVFISPLSVHMALAMTWNGTNGDTRREMSEAMHFGSLDALEVNEGFRQLIEDLLTADDRVEMGIANSIWYKDDFQVFQDFLDLNQTYFDAQVTEMDFGRPDAKDIINAWVAAQTNNRIEEIVEEVTRDHVMFLINAIYFKGVWTKAFVEEETRLRPFRMGNGQEAEVMTMEMKDDMVWVEREGYQVLELPYGRGNYNMLVMLPDAGPDELIASLDGDEWEALAQALDRSPPQEVSVRLPRFSFEYDAELEDPLKDLGIREAFDPWAADFSRMTEEQVFVSRVRHMSFVEVNEEGTEAAAATSVEISRTSFDPDGPVIFHVDRPFLFAIREKSTNTLLFIGRVLQV